MKRICVVGCGRIGRQHAKNLAGRAILSFHSRSPEKAERLGAEFRGERVFAHFEEVLEAPEIDALVICTPPEFHAAQAIAGLAAGKSVLVEKPLCLTPVELEQLATAAAAASGAVFMVAENYYYKPLVRRLAEWIRQGVLGEIQKVQVQKRFAPGVDGWRRECGALLEGGIHWVALISALFEAAGQKRPIQIAARFPGHRAGQPERHSVIRLEYAGGAFAELHYAWDTPSLLKGTFQHSRIAGSQGQVTFESNGLYLGLNAGRQRGVYFPGFRDLMGFKAMIGDFLHCLDSGRVPHSDLARARRDLEIVFAAYRSLA